MRIVNQETRLVPIDSVMPHPRNVNEGDVGAIGQSIAVNGFFGSIVVQRSSGQIVAGNHRWLAAQRAGASEIPATFIDVDDDTALRILLADNRLTRLGRDDSQALADLLVEIQREQGSLDGTGYDAEALDELLADLGNGVLNFDPVGLDEQGKLDERARVICPNCHHEFTP